MWFFLEYLYAISRFSSIIPILRLSNDPNIKGLVKFVSLQQIKYKVYVYNKTGACEVLILGQFKTS